MPPSRDRHHRPHPQPAASTRPPALRIACLLAILVAGFANAQPEAQPDAQPDPPEPVHPDLVEVASGFRFTEGVAWSPDGRLLFSDMRGDVKPRSSRIHAYDPQTGQTTVLFDLDTSGGSNGLYVDPLGRLHIAENSVGRRVTRIEPDGAVTVLADQHDGQPLLGPNDLVVDAHGGVYFSTPRFRNNVPREGVYYATADGVVTRVAQGVQTPNGVMLSPDGRSLYVADDEATEPVLYAYDVLAPGRLGDRRVFANLPGPDTPRQRFGPDGMTVDPAGNLYVAYDDILVYNPDGQLVERIGVPGQPTNVTFGGPDGASLYISAGGSIYRLDRSPAAPGSP